MFIMCKRNIIIPSPDGKISKKLYKGYVGSVEDWVTKTDYFKALVADKKIIVTETAKDKDLEKADAEKPIDNTKGKNGKKGEIMKGKDAEKTEE